MSDRFHSGERAIQEKTGEQGAAALNGRLIADRIPANVDRFLAQLHFCALGWASPAGDPWAMLLAGTQGFATSDEEGTVLRMQIMDVNGTLRETPLFSGLRQGDPLGVLLIELTKRRRLRVNGHVALLSDRELQLAVTEAFPNCPKYIQRRELKELPAVPASVNTQVGEALTEELVTWIESADTFFVASAHPDGSADASHRGGEAGFVRLRNGALLIPDYPGNSMFGTLGNFALNPRAGLVFVDFEQDRQLQMTGDVRLDLDGGEVDGETGGTGRWWEFRLRRWVVSPVNISYAWNLVDNSPFNP